MPTPPDYPVPPLAPPAPDIVHLPNQIAPLPSSNGFSDLYSLDSEDDSVFDEMVGNDKINCIKSISTYIRSPLVVANHAPPKVTKKRRKTLCRRQLYSTRRTQSDNAASDRFLSTALHYLSQ